MLVDSDRTHTSNEHGAQADASGQGTAAGAGIGAVVQLGRSCKVCYDELLRLPYAIYSGPLPTRAPIYTPRTDELDQYTAIERLRVRTLRCFCRMLSVPPVLRLLLALAPLRLLAPRQCVVKTGSELFR